MIDVASSLEYLHHGCPIPVVHCDLKPHNILLNKDMVAHVTDVSDFGISKFLGNEDFVAQTMTMATIGYMAPGNVSSLQINFMFTYTHKLKFVSKKY